MNRFYKRFFCIAFVGMFLAGCQNAEMETEDMTDTEYTKESIIATTVPDKVANETPQEESSEETEPEIIRSDPPAPLEEFMEYYWGLYASGKEKELEAKIISRRLTMEEAISLGEYEALRHLKDLGRDRHNARSMMVVAADLNDDGQEDIIEYCINGGLGGSEDSNSLIVYMKNDTGYELMYSQPLFDRGKNLRVIAYEGQKYLEMEGLLEKHIYWLQDWKPEGKAFLEYYRKMAESRLVFCEEEYEYEGKQIEEAALDFCNNYSYDIVSSFSQMGDTEVSRGDNPFWGTSEFRIDPDGRGREIAERYRNKMYRWLDYAKRKCQGKEYSFGSPDSDQAFRCDINNDGTEEEYIKSRNLVGISQHGTWWDGRQDSPWPTGRMYGRHEGKKGLLVCMESKGEETDFYEMCGLDIWNRELIPQMFWVDKAGGKNVTYILYKDEEKMKAEIEGYEINGTEYRKILTVECYGKSRLTGLEYEWHKEEESSGLPYTIEMSYPMEEGKLDNRAYVELRHMKDKEREKKLNLAIKEELRRITEGPEWKEKWTDEEQFPKFWVIKASEEEMEFGYGIYYYRKEWDKWDTVTAHININLKTGTCQELDSDVSMEPSQTCEEEEPVRSKLPAPLKEFREYCRELLASGKEEELEKRTISRLLTMEEAASLGEYEGLSHLKALGGGKHNWQRTMVAAADLDGDGQEDIIEFHINDALAGGANSNSLAVYKKQETGYELMYSQQLFDKGINLQVLTYKGENYLTLENVLEKDIYWLKDWELMGKACIEYDRITVGSRLVFCEEGYENEGRRIERMAAKMCEEDPNRIIPSFAESGDKEVSREENLFWGSGESRIAAEERGQELEKAYMDKMEILAEYANKIYQGRGYNYEMPDARQAFRCDINNDGTEEEYIKSRAMVGLYEEYEWWKGWEGISWQTGNAYGKHEGRWGLLTCMESGGKETDFYKMCGLDIWSRELTPQMFWADEAGGKNITYVLYSDKEGRRSEIEGYEINGNEYRTILKVECYGKGIIKKLTYDWKEDGESGGVPYTIEVSYPKEEGKPNNRAYVELRHMEDKELEEKMNLSIKEVIRQITDSREWKEKWTDEDIYPTFWVMTASEWELMLGYGIRYYRTDREDWDKLISYIHVDLHREISTRYDDYIMPEYIIQDDPRW